MEEDEDFMASLEATMKWRKRVDEENKLNHAELKRRCNAANISCVEDFDEDRQERYFTLSLPEEQQLYVLADDVKSLLSIPFEKYTFLSGYTAIWSFEYKVIEAAIEEVIDEAAIITASFYSFSLEEKRDYLIRRLRGKKSNDFMLSNEDKSISIKFDLGSAAFKELTNRNTITITISCLKVSQYEEAIDCLEKFSNALFFEIELSHGLQLNLVRERPTSKRGRAGLDRDKQTDLQFPRSEYDKDSISLYWYARNASRGPRSQFLEYYHVVELNFLYYSQKEIQRQVQSISKEPTFSLDNAGFISKIQSVFKSHTNELS